jgi:hypothetical protein
LISKVIFYITPEFCAYIPHNKFTWTMTIQDIHIILLISMKIFSLLNIKYKVINSPRCRIYILLSINYYTHKKKKNEVPHQGQFGNFEHMRRWSQSKVGPSFNLRNAVKRAAPKGWSSHILRQYTRRSYPNSASF